MVKTEQQNKLFKPPQKKQAPAAYAPTIEKKAVEERVSHVLKELAEVTFFASSESAFISTCSAVLSGALM